MVDPITEALQRLAFEFQHDREKAESEWEDQRLRLENILLRSERRLLPGDPTPENADENLREQLEALKRENEELRKRWEPVEAQRRKGRGERSRSLFVIDRGRPHENRTNHTGGAQRRGRSAAPYSCASVPGV